MKSVLERTRNRFQVASAEVEDMDAHERAVLAFVCVANQKRQVESVLSHVSDFVESDAEAPVVDRRTELLHVDADEMDGLDAR